MSSSDGSTPEQPSSVASVVGIALVMVLVLTAGLMMSGRMNTVAHTVLGRVTNEPYEAALREPTPERAALYSMRDLPHHPDQLLPLTSDAERGLVAGTRTSTLNSDWAQLLRRYEVRQRTDDNFTIRVEDNRTGELLELFTLTDERDRYYETGDVHWGEIDRLRRTETRRLSKKYQAEGVPRQAITIKWGRANQVLDARARERAFIEYEIRLAEALGLSLLATEIGTVETFNDDALVSSVGARSRYQIMPYNLRSAGIHHYALRAASGARVAVREELHPLLTMKPAFLMLRGYANAVGHEVPGISAYHAGPSNIYRLYNYFLTDGVHHLRPGATVLDAYIWGLTEGFDVVSRNTSFRNHSRGYVPAVYGSLRATEHLPIDTSATVEGMLVQVRDDASVRLSTLLNALDGASLDWGTSEVVTSTYDRFRGLNPHLLLPDAEGPSVPSDGNVLLTASVDRMPVRFFLPAGAPERLRATGVDVLDPGATRLYTPRAFASYPHDEMTPWDHQYASLVDDIQHFGFTDSNRALLGDLVDAFRKLADENPTDYRLAQRTIIETHAMAWGTRYWRQLTETAEAVRGQFRAPVLPPAVTDPRMPTEAPPRALDATDRQE